MTVRFSEDNDSKTIESALLEAKDLAEQEYFHYQVQGRNLTGEEKERSEILEICLGYIREALTTLKPG